MFFTNSFILMIVSGCGGVGKTAATKTEPIKVTENGKANKILVVYYSVPEASGKTVIPFNTHGGSGFSDTIATIKKLQPKANVIEDGLSIHRDDVEGSEGKIKSWLEKLGFKPGQ